jgi:hypothetical protein
MGFDRFFLIVNLFEAVDTFLFIIKLNNLTIRTFIQINRKYLHGFHNTQYYLFFSNKKLFGILNDKSDLNRGAMCI